MIRPPAVAGSFYPADPTGIEHALDSAFADAIAAPEVESARLRAIVAPHAGWTYSGAIAASAYSLVPPDTPRVVLLGPSHFVAFEGMAVSAADGFATPVGDVVVDANLREVIRELDQVVVSDVPHQREHSLEVHLPFLQRMVPGATLLPVAVGFVGVSPVAALLQAVADDALIIISTDLSHYLAWEQARARDERTAAAVLALDGDAIDDRDACGARGLRGLLAAARTRAWSARLLDLRNSGDTAGDRSRVVGYGAFAFA